MRRWDSDVEFYLDTIVSWPVLGPEESSRLLETIEGSTRDFRAALGRIPGTAHLIVERWQERFDRDLVTGMLCHQAQNDRNTDWSAHLDRVVGEIKARLQQPAAKGAGLAALVAEADILLETLEEIHDELSRLTQSRSRSDLPRARTFGLRTKAGRKALGDASAARLRRSDAKQQFACCNLRLVVSRAKRFRSMGVRFEDLIQEGNMGLLRAIDKFELERGHRFSTYAVWWIDQALVRSIQNQSRTVRLPSHIHDRLREVRRVEDQLRIRTNFEPPRQAVAEELGIAEEELERLSTGGLAIRSIDDTVRGDGEDGRTLVDLLEDPDAAAPEDSLHERRIDMAVKRSLRRLPARDRKILTLRYGFGGRKPLGLREIGAELGLSGERVRQIEKGALSQLSENEDLAALDAADEEWMQAEQAS